MVRSVKCKGRDKAGGFYCPDFLWEIERTTRKLNHDRKAISGVRTGHFQDEKKVL
jgi:hypothetical protein